MTQHLYSTVLKLNPTAPGNIPPTQGRLAQAAFLNLVRSIDPDLSAALHADNQRRPYTISPLLGNNGRLHNGNPHQPVWLRCTLLTNQLFSAFTQFLLMQNEELRTKNWGAPVLQLGQTTFAVTEMLTTPGSHPWAGYTSLVDLCQQWQNSPPNAAAHKIKLHFAGGVVFSRSSNKDGMGKFMEYFPYPEMFFGSVEARWRELTGLPTPMSNKELREYARETIVVSAFDMKTALHHYWGQPQPGGAGRITFELRDTANAPMTAFLNTLADFAFYSGVGAKTAMGMGQVRRV
jgi:CRISPR-associated endoribonuclease Cas6